MNAGIRAREASVRDLMRRRALLGLGLPFLAAIGWGCHSAPKRPVEPPPPVVSLNASVVAPPAPPPGPTPAERLAGFLEGLTPSTTPETLLLGIETTPTTGYGPLYGEGAHAPPEDKLHTLVIHAHDGRVEFAGELPFLAVPQENGFLYMGVASYERDDEEAERKRLGPKFGLDDEYGSKVYWYVASDLWTTNDRAKVDAERTRTRKRLEKDRKWGNLTGEDVNYVTSKALCSSNYFAEWTGGALAFYGSEDQSLKGFGKKNPPQTLTSYTDDAGLMRFARAILHEREPGETDPEISLDQPQDMFWSKIDWRKDSHVCLARNEGRVSLMGIVRLPNNSARSSSWEIPFADAPASLATNAVPPLPLRDVQHAFAVPKPNDVVISPQKSILVSQFRDRFVVYGRQSATPLLTIPASGRIVMAEWANGEMANSWARVGDPPKPPTTPICSCDIGMMCVEGTCVKPKTIFLTSTLYSGDLGGLAGADAKCQARADAAGIDGEFKAWLSDSKVSAKQRLAHANVPYVLVDGTVLAKDWAELTSGTLRAPIRLTEFLQTPTTAVSFPGCARNIVWTNTADDGTIAKKNRSCSDWTDGQSSAGPGKGAILGEADSETLWSNECASEQLGCKDSFPLYCIEQ